MWKRRISTMWNNSKQKTRTHLCTTHTHTSLYVLQFLLLSIALKLNSDYFLLLSKESHSASMTKDIVLGDDLPDWVGAKEFYQKYDPKEVIGR